MKRCYPLFFFLLLLIFLTHPPLILASAKNALDTWAIFVLPALFPFFILNRLCILYGTISLMGRVFRPITQWVFGLPRETAYVIITGYTTGAPVSSNTVAHLRSENVISKRTGDFLLPFTSNVSPLFLFSVVAAGFLSRPDLGITIALIHYGSNLFLGIICFRFIVGKDTSSHTQYLKNEVYPPLGKGLYESVMAGISTVTFIGGLMVLFFILIDILEVFGVFNIFRGFPMAKPLISGLIEITAGIKCTAVMNASLWDKLPIISGILGFGGFSAMLQIASQIKGTDLSLKIYMIYKTLQAILAWFLTTLIPLENMVSTLDYEINQGYTVIPLFFIIIFAYLGLLIVTRFIHHLQHKKLRR